MIVTRHNAAFRLVELGLLSPAALVVGGLTARERTGRNRHVMVCLDGGAGYFLKQVRDWTRQPPRTLAREAALCRLAQAGGPVQELVPRLHHYSARDELLVLERVDGDSLRLRSLATSALLPENARTLGAALGRAHDVLRTAGGFPAELPWILVSKNLDRLHPKRDRRSASAQLAQLIRRYPEIRAAIERTASLWQSNALMHGDMKLDNCLLRRGAPASTPQVILTDWELAAVGDVAWDLAGLMQSYLFGWLASFRFAPGTVPEADPRQAAIPYPSVQAALRHLWQSYQMAGGAGTADANLLERSVRFAGARLIQTAYELLQKAHHLTPAAVLAVQTALNLMTQPERLAGSLAPPSA